MYIDDRSRYMKQLLYHNPCPLDVTLPGIIAMRERIEKTIERNFAFKFLFHL